MPIRAFITGCSGLVLTADETAFIRQAEPWGLILFKRNVETPRQVLALTEAFRAAVGRADAPVLVDQEGGRVQRLGPPHWRAYPSAGRLGAIAGEPWMRAARVRLVARLMAHDLRAVGITVDCMPVLDVPVAGAHAVIGDRAYADTSELIARLGRAAAEGMLAGGVMPVIKHVPGHGRAGADSHHALPVVDADRDALEAQDFLPFRVLADMPAAMTAHVVYTALDRRRPATTSQRVVRDVIRGDIGFQGLLMSDDLSMQALSGTLRERAAAALRAGCDIGLHCNGILAEMEQVADAVPVLAGVARRRAAAALARITHAVEPLDPVDAAAQLDAALAAGS